MTEPTQDFLPIDTDGDGQDDAFAQQQSDGSTVVASDQDLDGEIDTVVTLDAEGNVVGLIRDIEGDGNADVEITLTEVIQYSATGEVIDVDRVDETEVSAPVPDPWSQQGDDILGDPFAKADYWFQQSQNGWCGPAALTQIIAEYTGSVDVYALEGQVAQTAIDNGWLTYDENGKFDGWSGMTTPDLAALMDTMGVPATVENGDMQTLAGYLAEGRELIVAVDSDEIWTQPEGFVDDDGVDGGLAPDHLVTVAGIDLERGLVLLNDPGHPDGELALIPIEQFDDAWRDSGHEMVVTDGTGPEPAAVELGSPDVLAAQPTAAPDPMQAPVDTSDQTPVGAPPATAVGTPSEPASARDEGPTEPAPAPPTPPVDERPAEADGQQREEPAQPVPSVVLAADRTFDMENGAVLLPVLLSAPVAAAGGAFGATLASRTRVGRGAQV